MRNNVCMSQHVHTVRPGYNLLFSLMTAAGRRKAWEIWCPPDTRSRCDHASPLLGFESGL